MTRGQGRSWLDRPQGPFQQYPVTNLYTPTSCKTWNWLMPPLAASALRSYPSPETRPSRYHYAWEYFGGVDNSPPPWILKKDFSGLQQKISGFRSSRKDFSESVYTRFQLLSNPSCAPGTAACAVVPGLPYCVIHSNPAVSFRELSDLPAYFSVTNLLGEKKIQLIACKVVHNDKLCMGYNIWHLAYEKRGCYMYEFIHIEL